MVVFVVHWIWIFVDFLQVLLGRNPVSINLTVGGFFNLFCVKIGAERFVGKYVSLKLGDQNPRKLNLWGDPEGQIEAMSSSCTIINAHVQLVYNLQNLSVYVIL